MYISLYRMLTLLLMPLAGLHSCVGLDFVTPSVESFLSKHHHYHHRILNIQAVKEKNEIESRVIESHDVHSPGKGAYIFISIYMSIYIYIYICVYEFVCICTSSKRKK
jgi:hypothetical protein